jgi:hypothetical protein
MTSTHKAKYKNTSPTKEKLCIGMKCNNYRIIEYYFFRYINYRILFLLENESCPQDSDGSEKKLGNSAFNSSSLS